jgi:hypothetical protein
MLANYHGRHYIVDCFYWPSPVHRDCDQIEIDLPQLRVFNDAQPFAGRIWLR